MKQIHRPTLTEADAQALNEEIRTNGIRELIEPHSYVKEARE